MLKFEEITIRNFMSFGNEPQTVALDYVGTTHILGEDKDTGLANGVGKTTVLNAICFALYDKPLSKISKTKLVNNKNSDKKADCEVTLTFVKDGDKYEVYKKVGKSSDVQVVKNDDHEKPITKDSINNTNKMIEEIVGISYELFKRTIVFTGSEKSFFEEEASKQRDVIEELLRLTEIGKKADFLKEDIKLCKKDIEIEEAIIGQKKKQIENHKQMLKQAEARIVQWENEKLSKIATIGDQLKSVNGIDFEGESKLHLEIQSVSSEHNTKNMEYQTISKQRKDVEKELNNKKSELDSLDKNKCPYCEQEFKENEAKKEAIRKIIIGCEEALQTLVPKEQDLYKYTSELFEALNVLKKQLKYPNLKELMDTKNNADKLVTAAESLAASENPHIEAYEQLKKMTEEKIDTTKLDELAKKQVHQEFLLKLLTDKKSFIRKRLINRNLPLLNTRLNEYVRELGLAHVVVFNADLSPTISQYGSELDYGNLSGGEKIRLNISLSFAFRDVRQFLHSKVSLLFTDEIDAGSLDTKGVEDILKVINYKCKHDGVGIYVISHRPEVVGKLDREIHLIKQGGFTYIDSIRDNK